MPTLTKRGLIPYAGYDPNEDRDYSREKPKSQRVARKPFDMKRARELEAKGLQRQEIAACLGVSNSCITRQFAKRDASNAV